MNQGFFMQKIMSKLRSLSTSFWSDPFIEDLTPQQKLLFIYLITNEKTNMLGVYESSIKKISFDTDIKKDDVTKYLKLFEERKKVVYRNNYVILVNYMKHQNFNTNMKKSAIDVYNSLPKELKVSGLVVDKANPLEGFERLLKSYGMVSKIEVEVEEEREEEVEVKIESKVYTKDIHKCFDYCLNFFELHLHPKDEKAKDKWLDTLDKLKRIDNIPLKQVAELVKRAREDSFWNKNFLSLTKLRKKNNDQIPYVVVFNEKFKNNGKQASNNKNNTGLSDSYLQQIHRDLQS